MSEKSRINEGSDDGTFVVKTGCWYTEQCGKLFPQ